GGVGTDHFDLAQSGRVEQTGTPPDGHALAIDGGMHVLSRSREIPWPLPLAHVLEDGAVPLRPAMDRCPSGRIEKGSASLADDGAESHRRVGRTEGGKSDLRDGS